MLKTNQYDIIDLRVPEKGINQSIAKEYLTASNTSYLENILPRPAGHGTVRFGVENVLKLTNAEQYIQETFYYLNSDGSEQLLLYTHQFTLDRNANELKLDIPNRKVTFSASNAKFYRLNGKVKIGYTIEKAHYSSILLIDSINVTNDKITLTLSKDNFPTQITEVSAIYYHEAAIYIYDITSETLHPDPIVSSLAMHSLPRSVVFRNQLMICNGVDNVITWDGQTIELLKCWVPQAKDSKDEVDNMILVNIGTTSSTISFDKGFNFDKPAFQVGQKVHLNTNEVITNYTITKYVENKKDSDDILDITIYLDRPIPIGSLSNTTGIDFYKNTLYYQALPPKFSYMYVANSRVWALGEGIIDNIYRSEATKVYFSFTPESNLYWFNDTTKTIPYIDIGYKQGQFDNIEAISSMGNKMVFLGRKQTQVWSGFNPLDVNDFRWISTLDVGLVHGNLIQKIGNDIYFVSWDGLRSFSTLNEANQFAVSSLNAIDPIVKSHIKSISMYPDTYPLCRSFHYQNGGFAGFKIGVNDMIICTLDTHVNSLTIFSGAFTQAQSLCTNKHRLFMSIDNRIARYQDELTTVPSFSDEGASINFSWSTPISNTKNKRYACKRYEVHLNYPSSFALSPAKNSVSLSINSDLRKTYEVNNTYIPSLTGDVLDTIALSSKDNDPQALGFRASISSTVQNGRLKFLSSFFQCVLYGNVTNGPLVIEKIRFFGRTER